MLNKVWSVCGCAIVLAYVCMTCSLYKSVLQLLSKLIISREFKKMNYQHYFTSASTSKQSSVPTTSSSSNSDDDEQLSSDSVSLEPPPKKAFPAQLTTEQS